MAIQSVQRALSILTLFSTENPRLGITEISRFMSLPKPTIHGIVQTLVEQGFLNQDPETKKYSLGLKIYELGLFLSGTLQINQVSGPTAQRLSKETGYMTRVALWDRDMVLITLNLFPTIDDTFLFRQLGLGPRVPAYSSAVGKAILSTFSEEDLDEYIERTELEPLTPNTITTADMLKKDLDIAREKGVAQECEEFINGISCISAPVFDSNGKGISALSISGAPDLLSDPKIDNMKKKLKQYSSEISLGMGCPPSKLY